MRFLISQTLVTEMATAEFLTAGNTIITMIIMIIIIIIIIIIAVEVSEEVQHQH